jgi:hypothetical protein
VTPDESGVVYAARRDRRCGDRPGSTAARVEAPEPYVDIVVAAAGDDDVESPPR